MIPAPAPWTCRRCGADLDSACERLTAGCTIDAQLVTHRLEQAGATLLAMRDRSPHPAPYRCALPEPVREAMLSYGWGDGAAEGQNPPSPHPRAITAMDRSYAWLSLIPQSRFVVRRIVAARSLINPVSGRHVISWRGLAGVLGCDYRAVQAWHSQGIQTISASLGRSG